MAVELLDVSWIVGLVRPLPGKHGGLTVVKQIVNIIRITFEGKTFGIGVTPRNFTSEIPRFKHRVHQQFQIVAGGRVAVKVD